MDKSEFLDLFKQQMCRLAPMAGISNLPYRLICKELGSGFTTTEEISARGLFHNAKKTFALADYHPSEKPLAFQIFGHEAEVLADAAQVLADQGADILDLNMGCPVKKIVSSGAGAALMKDPIRCAQIFKAIRRSIKIPFTIKIRGGWDDAHQNAVEIAQLAEAEGIDAITVHPRTRSQAFTGKAPWMIIKDVVESVSIPVTGNGDVTSFKNAQDMISQTGCVDVMIGRGALGTPWIFNKPFETLTKSQQHQVKLETIKRHLVLIEKHLDPVFAFVQMKKHLAWYTKGLFGSSTFRNQLYHYPSPEALLEGFYLFWETSEQYLND